MGHDREGRTPKGTWGVRGICLSTLILVAACTGSSKQNFEESQGLVLTGSVGDGPIVGADILVEDAKGDQVFTGTSDSTANYELEVPDGTYLPVTVRAGGGTDLVTGRPADFELEAVAFSSGLLTVNVSPYTTLAVKTARCMAEDLTPENVEIAWRYLDEQLNLGWDREIMPDPMSEPVAESNIATVLVGNEALGELVRRTSAALTAAGESVTADEVLDMLACDLADGRVDGIGPDVSPRAMLTALAESLGIRLEVIAGQLHVDGQEATALLDDALAAVLPGSTQTIGTFAGTQPLIDQSQDLLAVFRTLGAAELVELAATLDGATPSTARDLLEPLMTADRQLALSDLGGRVAMTDDVSLAQLVSRQTDSLDAPVPIVSLAADDASVTAGTSTRLSWASSDSEVCIASGGWSGEQPLSGTFQTPALSEGTEFGLSCSGLGGSTTDRVFVSITSPNPDPDPEPDPAPTLTFTASDASIDSGRSATLSWTAVNADTCSASDAWSGARETTGAQSVAPTADATYQLTCTGTGGSVSRSLTIQVTEPTPGAPVVTLTLADPVIAAGSSTNLSWSATNATGCTASGGWSGSTAVSGNQSVSPATSTSYTLTCSGDGGSDSATVNLTVNATAPTLTFGASEPTVNPGGSVTLTWSSTDTTGCTASGGWSGSKPTSGSDVVGPINASTTFTLSCSGPGGNVIEMLTIATINPVSLSWVAPTENVDGSALTDLAGYRIYWGTTSRSYTDMLELMDPEATGHTLSLASGDYYVAMTALDAEGNESAYSNEVLKTSP